MATPQPQRPNRTLADERAESARAMSWPGWRRVLGCWAARRGPVSALWRGPVLVHWFKMRARCGNCGLAIERGERDYFIGSMLFNLVVSEMLFAIVFVDDAGDPWPNVPWDTSNGRRRSEWASRHSVVPVLEAGLARLRHSAAARHAR